MKVDPIVRHALLKAFVDRGLEIVSLNANGNPPHPTDPCEGDRLRDTIRLVGAMGIGAVRSMSGLPTGWAGDLMPSWVFPTWPPETQRIQSCK